MKDILQAIQAVDHVHGAFLADAGGQLIASELPPVFDEAMLKRASEIAGRCITGLETAGAVDDIDLVFDRARLVIKHLGTANLFTLCDPEINRSFLNLTVNVAAERIRQRLETPSQASPAPPARDPKERLRKALKDELGSRASKALDILGATGDTREELDQAINDIERMVRLFIDKNKAGRIAGQLRGMLAD
jgi:predicted regulator of Ras-like GTPase activity (Roadblock/LC7/MglB family)